MTHGQNHPSRRSTWAVRACATITCLIAGFATAAGCAGSAAPESEPTDPQVGEAAQAITCVTISRAGGGTVADAQIANKSPYTNNYGSSGTANTGLVGSPGAERQTLVRFDLSSIPSNATVSSAVATVYASTTATTTVNVHRVTSSWSESTVSFQSFGGSFDSSAAATFSSGTAQSWTNVNNAVPYATTFDITSLAQSWVDGTVANYGVLLEQTPTSGETTLYRTSEWPTTAEQPSLSVCYTTGSADGVACSQGSDCASGNCVDGVCCDTACSGTCVACTAAKKGSGSDGTCGPIASQTDPDSECPFTAFGCGSTGQGCDGAGACIVRSQGAFCSQGICLNNTPTSFECDGLGSCVQVPHGSCGAYACMYPGCKIGCFSSFDCAPGHTCDTSTGTCL
jgi:hypothetical protein